MKTIDLTHGELMIQALKDELKIINTPHAIGVTLWCYEKGNTELEIRVTVFTTGNSECTIGYGSTISAAINNCRAQLMPKTAKIEEGESISVEV